MNKSKSSMTFNEYKKLTGQQYFGNDWGLFVVIDNNIQNKMENQDIKYTKQYLETIKEYDDMDNINRDKDIESNINFFKNIKQKERKYVCIYNCIKVSVTLIISSILTYVIFYNF